MSATRPASFSATGPSTWGAESVSGFDGGAPIAFDADLRFWSTTASETGNKSYVHSCTNPKCVILLAAQESGTPDTVRDHAALMVGFGVSSSSRSVHSLADKDAVTTAVARRRLDDAAVINQLVASSGATQHEQADLVSIVEGLVTLNWLTKSANTEKYLALILGGTTLQAAISNVSTPASGTSTGTPGFQPAAQIILASYLTALATNQNSPQFGVGLIDSALAGRSSSIFAANGTPDVASVQDAFGLLVPNTASIAYNANATQFQSASPQFTWTYTTFSSARLVRALSVGGISTKIGTGTTPASPGGVVSHSTTFYPKVIIFTSFSDTAGATIRDIARLCVGASVGATNGCISYCSLQAGTTDVKRVQSHANCLSLFSSSGAVAATAQVTARSATGFDVTWVSDVAGREYNWLALG